METLPRRVLCTIDFSEASPAVIAEAVALSRACAAEMTVLFVIPVAAHAVSEAPSVPDGVRSAVAADVEALLAPARSSGMPVRVCLRAGQPAREILEQARGSAPDLIVMGTHGREGWQRAALGSVSDEVVRNAPSSVLTIAHRADRPAAAAPDNVVVCAVGSSDSSARTVAQASTLAGALGARLVLLAVAGSGTPLREANARAQAAVRIAAAAGLPQDHIEVRVEVGAAAREIVSVARAVRARLVVVGGARMPLRRGAACTADEVIRRATCPVLTVRSPGHQAAGARETGEVAVAQKTRPPIPDPQVLPRRRAAIGPNSRRVNVKPVARRLI